MFKSLMQWLFGWMFPKEPEAPKPSELPEMPVMTMPRYTVPVAKKSSCKSGSCGCAPRRDPPGYSTPARDGPDAILFAAGMFDSIPSRDPDISPVSMPEPSYSAPEPLQAEAQYTGSGGYDSSIDSSPSFDSGSSGGTDFGGGDF